MGYNWFNGIWCEKAEKLGARSGSYADAHDQISLLCGREFTSTTQVAIQVTPGSHGYALRLHATDREDCCAVNRACEGANSECGALAVARE